MKMQLCYNSWHPMEILTQGSIEPSILDRRNRGVSMSSNLMLWGHGPFKFIFQPDRDWYSQFQQCKYGMPGDITHLNKPVMFRDEQEWWSEHRVKFALADIRKLTFMSASPGARIYPRKVIRVWKEVQLLYGSVIITETDRQYYPPVE